ncbi:hypothetical protein TBR22_A01840 [Luteitalea sp. TBR-22]|uniref:hypothetical protein n=1 Tax=Luteitalea sp. TBR-22 TaxID=2802971 RepID=UPI001AF428D9|nr:hypothetical protein [Luteitalea sp. TBR-22]BCS30983.1 hypothetical protein TBR22_A01840 [Luteitalea sp. TBR-22]
MTTPTVVPTGCPDLLRLQRWLDADDTLDAPGDVEAHVRSCAACRAAVDQLRQQHASVMAVLDDEEKASVGETEATLEAVRVRLASLPLGEAVPTVTATSPSRGRPRVPAGMLAMSWRLGTAATVLIGLVLAGIAVLDLQPVQASADWVISESQVRSRSWRTQPGKIRQEIYDTFEQETGKPAIHQRQTTVFSTIPGAEATTSRITDASGALISATWRRTDGWGATFDTRNGPHLILDPSSTDLEEMLATLTGEDAEALRFWIRIRLWQVRPQEQAASQAEVLTGGVAYFMRAFGTMQGPAEFHSDAAGYRIVATVEPHRNNPDKLLAVVEDTFSASSLMHERRVIRRVTRDGVVLGQSGRQLISRGDVDRATLDRLMADMTSPPPQWRVTRTTVAAALVEARRVWRLMKPSPAPRPQGAPPEPGAPPATR